MIFIKKRLLFVNGHLNVGGVERSLVDLLKYINYDKYEVDLVLFEELGDYINEIPDSVNVKFYDLTGTYGPFVKCILGNLKKGKWKDAFIRIVFTLEKIFGANMNNLLKPLFKDLGEYDCAIAYRMGFCTNFVAYVVNAKNKLTWWHHGSYDYNEEKTKRIEKIYEKFDYIVSVSEGCKKMLLEHLNIQQDKIVVIPNIIDFDTIIEKSKENIDIDCFDEEYVNIISIGRLSKEKGMINCVYACKKLVDDGYKIRWIIIGDGAEYEFIRSEVNKYNMEDNVLLIGSKKNPYAYLRKADIYVHTSYVESMSLTVLEAMCLDKALVVAKSIGPSEFIRNGENGLLVKACVDGLVNGVRMLIEDKNLFEKLSCKDKSVLKKYKQQNILFEVYKLINKI